MLELAVNLWDSVGSTLLDLFSQLDGNDKANNPWGLVIAGHSLGAGTAALLNIKIHAECLLGSNRPIKCFAFASPPVFCHSESNDSNMLAHLVDKAIKNCICFVHGDDAVPFMSVASVAKCLAQLSAIDDTTRNMGPLERMKLAGSTSNDVPQDLVNASELMKSPNVPGASPLTIPAERVVWTFSTEHGYSVTGCQREELSILGIFLSCKMMSDHFPLGYEDSLDGLAK